jgi:hypothetical protein
MKKLIIFCLFSLTMVACSHQRTPASMQGWQKIAIASGNIVGWAQFYQQGQQHCANVTLHLKGFDPSYASAANWIFEMNNSAGSSVTPDRIPASEVVVEHKTEAYGHYEVAQLPVSICSKQPFSQLVISAKSLPYAAKEKLVFMHEVK